MGDETRCLQAGYTPKNMEPGVDMEMKLYNWFDIACCLITIPITLCIVACDGTPFSSLMCF